MGEEEQFSNSKQGGMESAVLNALGGCNVDVRLHSLVG
jgi:hypothetical protein